MTSTKTSTQPPISTPIPSQMKTCAKCQLTMPAHPANFYPDKRSSDGFNSYCIPCSRLASAASHQRTRDRLLAYRESIASSTPLTPDQLTKHGFKICTSCGITKPATRTYYHFHSGSRDKFHSACKQCRNALARAAKKHPYCTPESFLTKLASSAPHTHKKSVPAINTQLTNVFPE
jgi:hypothetical protein